MNTTPQSFVKAAIAAEREQWTGVDKLADAIDRDSYQLAVHQDGMSPQHMPDADDLDADSDVSLIFVQAMAFTYAVESFMRSGDGSDPRVPPSEAEVAEAMYALRAAIAKAVGSAA
ncbi:MAG TPA: hypothetical protein VMA55_00680 [Acidovorax sp.]|nr:hypothetical protein [Acidovorax sp.]